jgi:crotonobetainyl-CoA:carnitine CoA-transferase CaiB-like acyl-CoA transferase
VNVRGALDNIKVIELCRVLAGPWASQTLADLGADVIKIEHPRTGDDTRLWGPPYLTAEDDASLAESAYFLCTNRNKRSVALDFSKPEGRAILGKLIADADVVIENFRPGTLAKYGLDYETLRASNPGLVYCSITAFGQSGPEKQRPGYDFAIQAMGGLMSITGRPDDEPGGGPMKVGVAVTDIFSGLYATIGILAALEARHTTGRGQHIDLALFDTQVAVLANQASNYLVSGRSPGRLGNSHPNVVPYQAFPTADGHIVLAIGNDEQFRRCCTALGCAALAADERFRHNEDRVKNRDSLVAELSVALRAAPTDHWLAALERGDVPCAPINRLDQVFAHPQAKARHLRVEVEHPCGVAPLVANPIRLSETPPTYRQAPPLLGQHSREVIVNDLGLSEAEFERLAAAGIVRSHPRSASAAVANQGAQSDGGL